MLVAGDEMLQARVGALRARAGSLRARAAMLGVARAVKPARGEALSARGEALLARGEALPAEGDRGGRAASAGIIERFPPRGGGSSFILSRPVRFGDTAPMFRPRFDTFARARGGGGRALVANHIMFSRRAHARSAPAGKIGGR